MESKFYSLSIGRIHGLLTGTVPEVLFLHGITTYSFLWEPVLSELTDYAALAIDLPGCGQST
ncbi:MAG: hypothetical protein D6762_05600, partial [Candidatus Neomarinimicrobiota bacterium]